MYFNQVRIVGTRYVKGNWGFPFIASFLVLLLAAAIMLTAKTTATLAEDTATCAYFALAIGVIFLIGNVNSKNAREAMVQIKKMKIVSRLVCLGKNGRKKGAVFDGPS